jgi:hypothetical protein
VLFRSPCPDTRYRHDALSSAFDPNRGGGARLYAGCAAGRGSSALDRQGIRRENAAGRAARRPHRKRWTAQQPFVFRGAADRPATGRFPAPNSAAARAGRQSGGARVLCHHDRELFRPFPRSILGGRQDSHRDLQDRIAVAARKRKHRRHDRPVPVAAPDRRCRRSRRQMAATTGALSSHIPSGGLDRAGRKASRAARQERRLLACPGGQILPGSGAFAREPFVCALAEAAGRPPRLGRRTPCEPGVARQTCRRGRVYGELARRCLAGKKRCFA